jgi:hypothetical protein
MKKKTLILFVIFYSFQLTAQIKYDYNWLFGYSGGENDTLYYGMNMNFSEDSVDILAIFLNIDLGLTNASISDSLGNLLFFTNGCSVSDFSGKTLENGDSLNAGGALFESTCFGSFPMYNIPQGILFIPDPGNPNRFYLFHQKNNFVTQPEFTILTFPYFYSLVEINSNFPDGIVIEKNLPIIPDTVYTGVETAAKHTNGKDWWILVPMLYGGYSRLLLNETGLEGPFFQDIGIVPTEDGEGGGQAVFTPDGSHYAMYASRDGVFLYDFDAETGLLSNFRFLTFEGSDNVGGVAFSSNSRFLYVSTVFKIYQFDLEAVDIQSSQITVAEYDGYQSPFPTHFWLQQLAPDCRIYINSSNGVDVLHVIKYPNRPGLECEVIQHGVQLPFVHGISLPNFPHYRTGTSYPICDSTLVLNITTPVFELPDPAQLQLSVYPNPASEVLHIRFTDPVEKALVWHLYNAIGQRVMSREIGVWEEEVKVDVGSLPGGIYFYGVEDSGNLVASGKIVLHE